MKRGSAALLLLGALLCAAVLLHCGGSEVVGMGGSEVVGKLVTKDSRVAVGAKVSVYINSFDTTKEAFKVGNTDNNGNYRIELDTTGTFFIYGAYNKNDTLLVAYIPDVNIDSVASSKKATYTYPVGTDTLLPPGSVSGRITVYSGQNSLITVNIPGTSYIAITDGAGNFKISNIPVETYTIWFSKAGFSTDSIRNITITSGRDIALTPVELSLDPNTPPPPPLGFTGTPNVKNGTVELKWNSVPYSNLYGYILSRNRNGSLLTDSILATIVKPDTTFVDTVYRSADDTLPKTVHYSIESIDKNSKHSVTAMPFDVSVVPPPKPGAVAIVSADSTDSSVTVRWNSFTGDFQSYTLHFRPAGKVVDSIISFSPATDTVCTIKTLVNGTMTFSVQVVNAQGIPSALSQKRTVGIIDSRPRFSVDTSGLDDSVNIGTPSMFTLYAVDANTGDSLSFNLRTPLAGLSVQGASVQFTPTTTGLIGPHRIVVIVNDQHGGLDSLVWNVRVVAHDVWAAGDSLIEARRSFGAAIANGLMYVAGGYYLKTTPVAIPDVESYDTLAKKWMTRKPMSNARIGPMVVSCGNGKIYAFGGHKVSYITAIEEYDPATDLWTTVGQMPFVRTEGSACAIGNKVYCIGGKAYQSSDFSNVYVKSIDIYDVSLKKWSKGPDMHYSRAGHQVIARGSQIYILGGTGSATDSIAETEASAVILNSVEVFDTVTKQCQVTSSFTTPRYFFGTAFAGNRIYLMGGSNPPQTDALDDLEELGLPGLTSTTGAPLPQPWLNGQSLFFNNRIYCIGGAMSSVGLPTRQVMVYYP